MPHFCAPLIERMTEQMNQRPLILVSNDDGVDARGIHALAEGMRLLGDVFVMAPDGPRSGMSSAITTTQPITYRVLSEAEGMTICSCSGTPTDCVKLAVSEVLDRKPDLLVSGVNHGGNEALSVHYSGTIGAAIEGCVLDIPSLGVSLVHYRSEADFSEAVRLAQRVAKDLLRNGLPHGTYLNLNVPNTPHVKGLTICRQADGRWIREFDRVSTPDGLPAFRMSGEYLNYPPIQPDNDTQRLSEGWASIVPCLLDVTHHAFMNELKSRGLDDINR